MSDNAERNEQIVRDFELARPTYKDFTANLRGIVEHMLDAMDLTVVSIDARTKTADSLREKASRPEKSYESLTDMTDLSGLRIITFLLEDVDRIGAIIPKYFQVDDKNSMKKADLLAPDQFGYQSSHYIVSYKDDRCGLPEFARFKGLRAEIQVRTALQHAWAAIDHRLRYKSAVEAPHGMRRKLNRISALLESADEDFSDLACQAADLQAQYRKQINKGDLAIDLNQESLELFVAQNEEFAHLRLIARDAGFHVAPRHPNSRNPYHNLLLTLHEVDIGRLTDLDAAVRNPSMRARAFLTDVHRVWQVPGRAPLLVIDLGGLLRLLILGSVESHLALRAVERVPFGPALQAAVTACLSQPGETPFVLEAAE